MTENTSFEPVLYCVIRENIPDMNPGKACAQAMHAQAEFDEYVSTYVEKEPSTMIDAVNLWRARQSFGTTIVVSAKFTNDTFLPPWVPVDELHYGKVYDETYPWRDYYGRVWLDGMVTCAWVFAHNEEVREYMMQFPLME